MNILLKRVFHGSSARATSERHRAERPTHDFGDGSGQPVHILINTRHAERAITFDPTLALPEAYHGRRPRFPPGRRSGLLQTSIRTWVRPAPSMRHGRGVEGLRYALRRLHQVNTAARARRNVERHYDLSGELYRLFLDEDMQYSCAYFERPDMTLEEAQLAKKRHIAAKLKLKPGQKVLDIGSGWGGLGSTSPGIRRGGAGRHAVDRAARASRPSGRAREGLENRVHFEIRDYRDSTSASTASSRSACSSMSA